MTPNEINEAIMMSLGYVKRTIETARSDGYQWVQKSTCWMTKEGDYVRPEPNYYSDLNACAEFEASLAPLNMFGLFDQSKTYINLLSFTCGRPSSSLISAVATAPQRCEAYLKMKGLWKE